MSTIKDLTQFGRLVARHHGWAAAKAIKSYTMNEADGVTVSKCGVDLLKVFPQEQASSALMSAALAVSLEGRLDAPIHVVAGALAVEGVPVFADNAPFDVAKALGAPGAAWNGHVWMMVGGYVVDISIFRTAYSAHGPAVLAKHLDLVFGSNQGLYVDLWKRTSRQGLRYEPHYVLSAEEVTALMGGAYQAIKASQAGKA